MSAVYIGYNGKESIETFSNLTWYYNNFCKTHLRVQRQRKVEKWDCCQLLPQLLCYLWSI